MPSLIGNKPNQVPSNGDLGTLAFQDASNPAVGNLTFTGTGNRILGDFSNATIANRVAFQTSTVNGQTVVGVIPNGTSTATQLHLFSSPDYTNYSRLAIQNTGSVITFLSDFAGTGSYLPVTFNTGGSERLRIDTSGNVGIGVSSPTQKLTVDSTISIKNPSGGAGQLLFSDAASDFAGRLFYNHDNDNLQIFVNSAEAMRIDSSGNLCIGTTSASEKLRINAGASTRAIKIVGDDAFIEFDNSGTSIAGGGNLTLKGAGAINAISGGSGGVSLGSGATSWTSISDEKQKDIIEPIADAVNKISTLRAVIGKYKTDKEGTRRSFLIAQDVQKVLPEAVDIKDDEEKTLGLRYTEVIPLLVASIKELKETVDAQAARIAALESK
jgi:hypothetical protein